jgi:hypothetical protein
MPRRTKEKQTMMNSIMISMIIKKMSNQMRKRNKEPQKVMITSKLLGYRGAQMDHPWQLVTVKLIMSLGVNIRVQFQFGVFLEEILMPNSLIFQSRSQIVLHA